MAFWRTTTANIQRPSKRTIIIIPSKATKKSDGHTKTKSKTTTYTFMGICKKYQENLGNKPSRVQHRVRFTRFSAQNKFVCVCLVFFFTLSWLFAGVVFPFRSEECESASFTTLSYVLFYACIPRMYSLLCSTSIWVNVLNEPFRSFPVSSEFYSTLIVVRVYCCCLICPLHFMLFSLCLVLCVVWDHGMNMCYFTGSVW